MEMTERKLRDKKKARSRSSTDRILKNLTKSRDEDRQKLVSSRESPESTPPPLVKTPEPSTISLLASNSPNTLSTKVDEQEVSTAALQCSENTERPLCSSWVSESSVQWNRLVEETATSEKSQSADYKNSLPAHSNSTNFLSESEVRMSEEQCGSETTELVFIVDQGYAAACNRITPALNTTDNTAEICAQKLESISLSCDLMDNTTNNQRQTIDQPVIDVVTVVPSNQTSKSGRKSLGEGKKKLKRRKKGESRVRFDALINETDSGILQTEVVQKKKKKKIHTKRFAKTAGKRLWKGVRLSCKFLWSGLILYAKPFGGMDPTAVAKAWEESRKNKRQFTMYNDPPNYRK